MFFFLPCVFMRQFTLKSNELGDKLNEQFICHTHHISLIRDILSTFQIEHILGNQGIICLTIVELWMSWYFICFHFASSICIVAICNRHFWHGQCSIFNRFIAFVYIFRGFVPSLSLTSFCEYCSLYEIRYNLILETTLINGKQKIKWIQENRYMFSGSVCLS